MSGIPSSNAKDQLIRIDGFLTKPHVLIGGLAVQQYYPARDSSDIDIICDDQTAKRIINELYPTREYEIQETNEDDLRPAYIISSREHEGRVIFIGPKITEREPYRFIEWDKLDDESRPFRYKNQQLKNIRVPCIEKLAFIKLLSFLSRVQRARDKGEKDLTDLIDLSNKNIFRINCFIDLIIKSRCENYIQEQLNTVMGHYSLEIWNKSSLCDILRLTPMSFVQSFLLHAEPALQRNKQVYMIENSFDFYNKVAPLYDKRNTKFLYEAHQEIIGNIRRLLPHGGTIVDVGCGTGRHIASHFIHDNNISWIGIDGSKSMLDQFTRHTQKARMAIKVYEEDTLKFDWSKISDVDLCLISFSLSSMSSIEFIINAANTVNPGGYILIADIHPSYTLYRPDYDFDITPNEKVTLKPNPVYPDKIAELLLSRSFVYESQKTITDDTGRDYAFISIYKKTPCI